MTVSHKAFLDLEFSLERALSRAFDRKVGDTLERELRQALQDGDFSEAYRLVSRFSLQPVVDATRGLVESHAVSAFLLGQSFFTHGNVHDTQVGSGAAPLPFEVQQSARVFSQSLANTGAESLRKELDALVAALAADTEAVVEKGERKRLHKAAIPGLGAALNRAVSSGKQASFGLGANLSTSRLASFGAITQMQSQGAGTFQRSAVLDADTCPVCRSLHGQVFTLGDQGERLSSLLLTDDPMALKAAAPFPKQNKAALGEMASMGSRDLTEKGYDIPPSHPWCRCILVPVGDVPDNQILGPAALQIPRAILQEEFGTTTNVASKKPLLDELGAKAKPFPVETPPPPPPLPPTPAPGTAVPTGTTPAKVPEKFAETSKKVSKKITGPKATQPTSDLDVLYAQAAEADPLLKAAVTDMAGQFNGRAVFPPGLKGRARVVEKATAKYGGDFAGITDLSRATIEFDRIEDLYGAVGQLEEALKQKGMTIARMNDRFLSPTPEGYSDIILGLRAPSGHVVELQLNTSQMVKAKEINHLLYEQERSILAKAKIEGRGLTAAEQAEVDQLVAQQQAAYSAALTESLGAF